MPNLTDLVQVIPATEEEEPEDFFASAPGFLFTDDLRNQHGDPGSVIVYKNGRFGNLELRTADPEAEDERQLFSHYLWNAAVKLAELMSFEGEDDGDRGAVDARWSVKGERVLELGAGWCFGETRLSRLLDRAARLMSGIDRRGSRGYCCYASWGR